MSKFELRRFNMYLRYKNQWVDVADKKAIIYGAGQGCMDMMNVLCLPNVEKVVDFNEKIHGKELLIQNQLIAIESPEILKTIDWNSYYIVISSIQYGDEILKNIRKFILGDALVGIWNEDICYCYENIEDMVFLDPVCNSKLTYLGMIFDRYHIINDFYKMCDMHFKAIKIDRFIMMRKGAGKLVFLFGNENDLWVYSVRGKRSSLNGVDIQKDEEVLSRKKYNFLENHNLDHKITIFRNEDGVLVQKYACNQIDFDNLTIRKKVIQECRRIHQMDSYGLEKNHLIEDAYDFYMRKFLQIKYSAEEQHVLILEKVLEIMENNISIIKLSSVDKVIHADLNTDNMVLFQNEVVFIDWEFLSIGNPMLDLMYFLFRIHYSKYLLNKITFFKVCEDCFSELPTIVRDYCIDEDVLSYQEIAEAVLKSYLIRYSLEIYFDNNSKGLQQLIELVTFLDNL